MLFKGSMQWDVGLSIIYKFCDECQMKTLLAMLGDMQWDIGLSINRIQKTLRYNMVSLVSPFARGVCYFNGEWDILSFCCSCKCKLLTLYNC